MDLFVRLRPVEVPVFVRDVAVERADRRVDEVRHDCPDSAGRVPYRIDLTIPPAFDGLPLHRAKAEAACRAAFADEDVVGMAVAGSFAAGNADELSDVDLRLYVRDGAVDAFVDRVPDIARTCGQVVSMFTGEHVGIPTLTIVVYDDLVHVDFDVLSASGVAEHNEGLPVVVLWDRDELAAALPGTYEPEIGADVRWIEDRIWPWCWYIQTKVIRGELYEALDGLQYVRDRVLFRLLAFHRGTRPAGARRAEALVGEFADAFARTVPYELEPVAVLEALRAEIALYVELADPLLAVHGVDPNDRARHVMRAALESGLEWRPSAEAYE